MIGLFGWLPPVESGIAESGVLRQMSSALRPTPQHRVVVSEHGSLAVGGMARPGDDETPAWTHRDEATQSTLWFAGEVFALRNAPRAANIQPLSAAGVETLAASIRTRGIEALRDIDGEFQLALWDPRSRSLLLAVDRYCTTPLYWAATAAGVAFAFGVRGVLMAPGVATTPDLEAIREAVTFGAYRLGERTNISGVQMVPPATAVTFEAGRVRRQRYWWWNEIAVRPPASPGEAVEESVHLWKQAISRRLAGLKRPGQTLSGGRDSRAILAEAAPRCDSWTAITYGLPGCDDATYARRAAAAAGARWLFLPLYQQDHPSWLDRRTDAIQATDGLVGLSDLMHVEHLPRLAGAVDGHLSGFVGDAIAGPSHDDITTWERALIRAPYYGSPLSYDWHEAGERLRAASTWQPEWWGGAILFEHKVAQATGRGQSALAAHVPVRRPFLDLDFMEYAVAQGAAERATLYDRWLVHAYPRLFAIPIQKTGAPAGAGATRLQFARASRIARRGARALLARTGRTLQPWSRGYTDDEGEWARPAIRRQIEATILRPESSACEIWGRETVAGVLREWFDHRQGPAQVVGALYTWEAYHRDLAAFLRAARQAA